MLIKEKYKNLDFVLKRFREFLRTNRITLNTRCGINVTDKEINAKKGDLLEWVDERYDLVFSSDYNDYLKHEPGSKESDVLSDFKTYVIYIRNLSHKKAMERLINISKEGQGKGNDQGETDIAEESDSIQP